MVYFNLSVSKNSLKSVTLYVTSRAYLLLRMLGKSDALTLEKALSKCDYVVIAISQVKSGLELLSLLKQANI